MGKNFRKLYLLYMAFEIRIIYSDFLDRRLPTKQQKKLEAFIRWTPNYDPEFSEPSLFQNSCIYIFFTVEFEGLVGSKKIAQLQF